MVTVFGTVASNNTGDWGGTAYSALEILQPRSTLDAAHRHNHAYPGLEFSIRVAAVGGVYPYTYSLANGGAGMSINARTGVITWPSPVTDCTPTVTVTDSHGSTDAQTWTITVGTTGWRFVDAVSGTTHPTGDGTIANPWRTLEDVIEQSSAGDRVIFRAGTYDFSGITTGSAGAEGLYLDVNTSTVWLAYPGESPVLDYREDTLGVNAPAVYLNAEAYVDGFEIKDGYHKFIQCEQFTIWRCDFWGLASTGVSNNAYVMTGHGTGRYGIVIQDSTFRDGVGGNGLGYLSLIHI